MKIVGLKATQLSLNRLDGFSLYCTHCVRPIGITNLVINVNIQNISLVNKRITNFILQSSSDLIIVNILSPHSKGQKLASEI